MFIDMIFFVCILSLFFQLNSLKIKIDSINNKVNVYVKNDNKIKVKNSNDLVNEFEFV